MLTALVTRTTGVLAAMEELLPMAEDPEDAPRDDDTAMPEEALEAPPLEEPLPMDVGAPDDDIGPAELARLLPMFDDDEEVAAAPPSAAAPDPQELIFVLQFCPRAQSASVWQCAGGRHPANATPATTAMMPKEPARI